MVNFHSKRSATWCVVTVVLVTQPVVGLPARGASAGAPRGFESQGPTPGDRGRIGYPRRLAPRTADDAKAPRADAARRRAVSGGSLSMVLSALGALGIVLGLFLVFVWFLKRGTQGGSRRLPPEVVEWLGRAPLADRQQIHLLRVGRKLILVSVSSTGTETLTEITDADEVDRLAGLCSASSPTSATHAFRQVLGQFARQGAARGPEGSSPRQATFSARRGMTFEEATDV